MAIPPGLTLDGGDLYPVAADGQRGPEPISPVQAAALRPQTIMVHGYRFRLGEAHKGLYKAWRQWCPAPAVGLSWRSYWWPWQAWMRGYRTPYRLAWDNAARTGGVLREILRECDEPVSLVGHSLGTRVILSALDTQDRLPVDRVLFLNGAASTEQAKRVLRKQTHVDFLSIGSRRDRVLRYLARYFTPHRWLAYTIGIHGLGSDAPEHWDEIWLGQPSLEDWAEQFGWELEPGGHWAHRIQGNHGLFGHYLSGQRMAFPEAAE